MLYRGHLNIANHSEKIIKRLCKTGIYLLIFLSCNQAVAAPAEIVGEWQQAPESWQYHTLADLKNNPLLTAVDQPKITGGVFIFQAKLELGSNGRYVVDFKNSGVIAHFKHYVYNSDGRLITQTAGGIESTVQNDFFMRNGRIFSLDTGHYQLVTIIDSPYFVAQPKLFITAAADYQKSMNAPNVLSLLSIGIFFGLLIHYAMLGIVRRRIAECMYAFFVLGAIFFAISTSQLMNDFFGLHWFYMPSVAGLFMCIAYVPFVMGLLDVRRKEQPRLYQAGLATTSLLMCTAFIALLMPHWSLEITRFSGVVFLLYGLTAGVLRARQGNQSAKLYLLVMAFFFPIAMYAITHKDLPGQYYFYIEHIATASLAAEAIALALIISYQVGVLETEKEEAVTDLAASRHIALTDALTGLPNRHALDKAIRELPSKGSLTIVDLDGLKFYNDNYGHEQGDRLITDFAHVLQQELKEHATLHRLGGDEYAITCPSGDLKLLDHAITATVDSLRANHFESAGASAGSAHKYEGANKSLLMQLADTRMYDNKRKRKALLNNTQKA